MSGRPNQSHDPATGAREVEEGVFVFTSGAFALNSGVAFSSRKPGKAPSSALLVDPGYFPGEIDRIAAFLASRGSEAQYVALTHSDWDHVAGAARWPEGAIIASSEYPRRVASDSARISSALQEFDRKLYVVREQPWKIPDAATVVGSPSDLVWKGPRVRLLPAGGHTPDGLMVLLPESGVLFAGDHLSDREIPFVGDSVEAYRTTLQNVRRLVLSGEVRVLVPGHGDRAERAAILERIEEDEDYLERLVAWVRDVIRTVVGLDGILERGDEVVFGKGWDNPDVRSEHRANVDRVARSLGVA